MPTYLLINRAVGTSRLKGSKYITQHGTEILDDDEIIVIMMRYIDKSLVYVPRESHRQLSSQVHINITVANWLDCLIDKPMDISLCLFPSYL